MTRNNARQIAVRMCFSADFLNDSPEELVNSFFQPEHYASLSEEDAIFRSLPDDAQMIYICRIIKLISENLNEIDSIIRRFSSTRKPERISRTALAVLRCALCEILYFDDIPESVSICEAVLISKEFDSPETVSFINGLLGAAVKEKMPGTGAPGVAND